MLCVHLVQSDDVLDCRLIPGICSSDHGKRLFDLTHTLTPAFPTFFGTPGITLDRRYRLKKDGANVGWWHVLEHAGTHVDAPLHYSDAGASADKIAPEQLVVPLAVIDVAQKAARNADYQLSRQDLLAWEERHGRLPDNACVAMHADWAQHLGSAGGAVVAHSITFFQDGANTIIQGDVNGDTTADFHIQLNAFAANTLTINDFVL